MKTFSQTRYKGCRIISDGTYVHVLGPTFIYLTSSRPGYLEHCAKYIDRRI